MSGIMRIRFEPDMPVAAVEVLSPDLDSVTQIAVRPGTEQHVPVPSERSFIRVHLPSGRIVTLRHDGNLNYVINRSVLEGRRGAGSSAKLSSSLKNVQGLRSYHQVRSTAKRQSTSADSRLFPQPQFGVEQLRAETTAGSSVLAGGISVTWTPPIQARLSLDGQELAFAPHTQTKPYTVRVTVRSTTLAVSLPGTLDFAYVREDRIGADEPVISVRASTTSDVADTVGGYMARADYYAAETMASWAEEASALLMAKMADPYAATVGAYLLLRLERFDLMHNWVSNLAELFPFLADGCVLWAWQNIRERRNEQIAAKYLLEAVKRGLPIHTEGLRLLSEGLRLIGRPGMKALADLTKASGRVVWNSPFTARLEGTPDPAEVPTTFDIDYLPIT